LVAVAINHRCWSLLLHRIRGARLWRLVRRSPADCSASALHHTAHLSSLFVFQATSARQSVSILLIPLLLTSLDVYAGVAFGILQQIPGLRDAGLHGDRLISSLHIGMFHFSLEQVADFSFWLSLAIIIVLRSARMSSQQAVLETEMAAAREVQQVILPERVEPVPGFAVEAVYEPAQQVGGDFFQILPDGDGGLLVVVGDVAGKGLPAAMLVSVLVGAIRGVAEYTKEPAELLANLNERLVGRGGGGFSTALVAHIAWSRQHRQCRAPVALSRRKRS
jgi:phosphoserine phosphatase RsbU/P